MTKIQWFNEEKRIQREKSFKESGRNPTIVEIFEAKQQCSENPESPAHYQMHILDEIRHPVDSHRALYEKYLITKYMELIWNEMDCRAF